MRLQCDGGRFGLVENGGGGVISLLSVAGFSQGVLGDLRCQHDIRVS